MKLSKMSFILVVFLIILNLFSGCSNSGDLKPNIIFIFADDLGYGHLGCYGQEKINTPRLDRMAFEGIRFTQFYSGSSVCAPARCTLMTGLHTGHAYVRSNNGGKRHGDGLPLRLGDRTIAECLQEVGYTTGMFGKWSLGIENTTGSPDKKGFDEFLGFLNQVDPHSYYSDFFWKVENGKLMRVQNDETKYTHNLLVDATIEFIKKNKDEPFFLYLPFFLPHASLRVPEDSLKEYLDIDGKSIFSEKPFDGNRWYYPQPLPHATFAGMVSRLDRDVGRILDLLKKLGIDENTIVFFTSDNGPHRDGGGDPKFFQGAGTLRDIKGTLYEGGIRVPMIVRWPGIIESGIISSKVWALWDVMPTILEIAEINVPNNIDGISMLHAMLGKKQENHEFLYWELKRGGLFWQAVRMNNWKSVKICSKDGIQKYGLYNLKTDIGEKNNLASMYPEVVTKMEAYIEKTRSLPEYGGWEMPETCRK